MQAVQSIKGISYVLVTSVVLYFFIHKHNQVIKTSEKEYQQLFDKLPVPLFLYDAQTLKILHVNKVATEQYGYSAQELKKMTITQIRPPEDINLLHKLIDNDAPKRVSKDGEVRHKRKSGEVFYVKVHSFATTFKEKQARLVLAIDINEKVLAQNELKERNLEITQRKNYLRSLIDSSSNFLVRTSMDGRCTFINQAFLQFIGEPEESIINQNIFELMNEAQAVLCKKSIRDGLHGGQKIISTSLLLNKTRWIDWEIAPILNESNERHIKELQWVGRDVTEKHEYLQSLKEYKEKLQEILNSVNDLICSVWSDDFSIIYVNEASRGICGYSPQDFYENSDLFFSVIAPEYKERVANVFWQLNYSAIETSINIEFAVIHRDGTRRQLLTRAQLKRNHEHNRFQIIATITDITALKDAEKRLTDIAHEQSHRVRNSVSSILAVFELFEAEKNNAILEEPMLVYVHDELTRLDKTITDIVKRTENLQQYGKLNKP
ncbi:PAS domain-containing protein [Flexibacter flexilis]|nr:PAS domain S-box protein [Flexibacter flexilis]